MIIDDISDQKQGQEALIKSEQHPDFNPGNIVGKRDDKLKDSQSSKCLTAIKQMAEQGNNNIRG
jgi:hypothetical protein